ncbi:metal-dependent hydrolase [Paenibacillus thalictri]|uniref:Metal-dependent hydrolase n=1 Tax=Paenibacillus thalictri TaxID=2527873 RepID=A0A4Q9DPM9_9BACL|nr:metal-dependent hydrolase [Paenibacillus thalictri]TBL76268.1 metal-dependent hydrolase [Paenibacillus thalictri]
MDTVTHTLFGLTLYGALNKTGLSPALKKSLFLTAVIGSNIPDIDVVAGFTETGKIMQQMWHRGITHSVFMVPVWALLLSLVCFALWKRKDRRIFWLGVTSVLIHDTSDMLNTWGTGFFEPISHYRVSFGALPIVDVVLWAVIAFGWLGVWLVRRFKSHSILRAAWTVMAIYAALQLIQVATIYSRAMGEYIRLEVSAGFVPGQFQVFGLLNGRVDIMDANVWSQPRLRESLASDDTADLKPLFKQNPRALTLYTWSPFVVVVNNDKELGIYDPRFYKNGSSFLHESIKK